MNVARRKLALYLTTIGYCFFSFSNNAQSIDCENKQQKQQEKFLIDHEIDKYEGNNDGNW